MADGTQIKITALDATTAAFRSVQNNINSLQGSLRSIAGPLAAAFSVAAIGTFSKSLIDAADRLNDVSEQTGIAVRELSALGNAATLNGSNTETLNTALVKLNRSISEAAGGSKEQQKAFEALGISAGELSGLSTTEVFFKISDAFAGAENGANKTAIAMALLGRSGAELIPVLNQGSTELRKYSATFNDDFAKASAQFNDNVDRMIIRLKMLAVEGLGPVIAEMNKFDTVSQGVAARMKKDGFWRTFLGMTEIGEFLGYGVSDKVIEEVKKIEAAQKKIPTQTGTKALPPIVKEDSKIGTETLKEYNAELKVLDDALKTIETPAGKYYRQLQELEKIQHMLFPDEIAERLMVINEEFENAQPKIKLNDTALKQYSASIKNVQDALQDVAVRGLQSLEDALVGVYSGTVTVKDAFKSMAVSIIQDLIRIQVQRSITGPIADALGGLFSAQNTGQGFFGGIGARALGGSVMANEAYMVGEKGPELFVPGKTGSIVPNNQLGGSGATINQTINISAGVSQTVRAEVMNMLPRIMEATKAAVADSKRRGGTFGKMMA
jgi:hypothetical protein